MSAKPSLLVVVPTYGALDYAAKAIHSIMENTTVFEPFVLLIDDCSPELQHGALEDPSRRTLACSELMQTISLYTQEQVKTHYFTDNGGLTRSWNRGLALGIENKHDYVCVTNSDVYFPNGWDVEILKGLEKYALVGPVTNAPGTEHEQYVGHYSVLYNHDSRDNIFSSYDSIRVVQNELLNVQHGRFKQATLNGFCMVAKTATWDRGRYSASCVFCPRNDVNSKGKANPTPLMTLNEYELQKRWHHLKLQSAICLGSYVFHYRAVSRGKDYLRGDWARLPPKRIPPMKGLLE